MLENLETSEVVAIESRITMIGNRLYRVEPLKDHPGVTVDSTEAVWQVTVAQEHLV